MNLKVNETRLRHLVEEYTEGFNDCACCALLVTTIGGSRNTKTH